MSLIKCSNSSTLSSCQIFILSLIQNIGENFHRTVVLIYCAFHFKYFSSLLKKSLKTYILYWVHFIQYFAHFYISSGIVFFKLFEYSFNSFLEYFRDVMQFSLIGCFFTMELVLFLGIVLRSFFYYLCFVRRIALLKAENIVFILRILIRSSFGRMFVLFKRVWFL